MIARTDLHSTNTMQFCYGKPVPPSVPRTTITNTSSACWISASTSTDAATAGVAPFTFHTSRHTFATQLLTHGVDIYTVSKLLGYTDLASTQIHARVVDEKKRAAVDLLPAIDLRQTKL